MVKSLNWLSTQHLINWWSAAYLLAEGAVGTDGDHFESLDCQLKVEAALMLS
jgi:hypothetical protein